MTLREKVWDLDHGRCVNCGKKVPRRADIWIWHVHHVIKQQELRRRGVSTRSPAFCVLLCRRCHERQTAVFERVPFHKLPGRVVEAVDRLGPWAQDRLRIEHPVV